jgi:hypothetical protein
MCHLSLSSRNARYFDASIVLPMTSLPSVVLTPLEFNDFNFLASPMLQNRRRYLGASNQWFANFKGFTLAKHQHLRKFYRVARCGVEGFDKDFVAFTYAVLFTTGLDYAVHGFA